MSDDTLLRELASQARNQRLENFSDDELWEKYAASTLRDDEWQALLERTPPGDIDRLKRAYAPLDQDFKDSLAFSVMQQVGSFNDNLNGEDLTDQVVPANVVPIETSRTKQFAPFAMAATLLLAIGAWQFGLGTPSATHAPDYTLTLLGGSSYRSPQTVQELPVFAPGDRLEIRLTPATAMDSAVQGAMYIETDGRLNVMSNISIEHAPSGAIRMIGQVGDTLLLGGGSQQLIVLLSSEGLDPDSGELLGKIKTRGKLKNRLYGDGWQAWLVDIVVDAAP